MTNVEGRSDRITIDTEMRTASDLPVKQFVRVGVAARPFARWVRELVVRVSQGRLLGSSSSFSRSLRASERDGRSRGRLASSRAASTFGCDGGRRRRRRLTTSLLLLLASPRTDSTSVRIRARAPETSKQKRHNFAYCEKDPFICLFRDKRATLNYR